MTTQPPRGGGPAQPRRAVPVPPVDLRRTARKAVRVFRPSDGTGVLHLNADGVDATLARKVLDLSMRVSEMMLSHGASANDVTVTALRITKAYELRSVHVDVTYTSIYVSYYRGHDREPLTTFRVVRARSIDYTRLQRLQGLVNKVEAGLDIDQAFDLFAAIVRAPHPYRRWVITAANAGTAASVCILRDASLLIILVSLLSAGIADVLVGWLARKQVPAFFMQALGASVPTIFAIALMRLVYDGALTGIRPELIVAGGIVVMLSGLSAVGAAQDAIDGYYLTAGARTFEVMLMTLGIIVGILAALALGARLGVPVVLSAQAPPLGNLTQQVVGVLLVSAFFAVSTYAGPRTVVLCALTGLLGWGGYLLGNAIGLGDVSASALGAFVPALVAGATSRRLQVPSLALITAALVPLMPGTAIYRGLLEITVHTGSRTSFGEGTMTLILAGAVGLALAAGASLGTYLARPSRANLRHAAPRGAGSPAETSLAPDSPDAEATTARAVEATTGTIPVVRD